MKLIILDIVAITAFLAYAQKLSLVSAASAVPLPALTASSTPFVAPVERRLRPSVVPGNEAANGLADRVSQLFLGGASKAVGATFNGLARSHEKFRDVTVLRHYRVFDRQLAKKGEDHVILMTKFNLKEENSKWNAAGRMYLRRLMEMWKDKSLSEIVEILKLQDYGLQPKDSGNELNVLVELDRLVEKRKTKAQDKIEALEKQLNHPKPGDSQADLQAKIDAEKNIANESLMSELEPYYQGNELFQFLYASKNRNKDHLLTRLYEHWKAIGRTAVEVEQTLRAIDPSVSEKEVVRAIKAVGSVKGR